MNKNSQRPVFLNLLQIHLPLGGVLSIFHRATGILLVLAIPLFIYLLQLLYSGENGFAQAVSLLQSTSGKLLASLSIWVLIQHSLSGIRHLLMDMGFSYQKNIARTTASIVFALSALLIILTGVLIWL